MARRLLFLTMYLLLWLPAAAETGRAPLYIVNGVVRTTVSDIPEKNIEKIIPSTLEGCVVRVCDIIAYLGKDRQDAIRANLIESHNELGDGGIGSRRAKNFGFLGNGGDADGIAAFCLKASDISAASIPSDALFYGDTITKSGTYGYTLPNGSLFDKDSKFFPANSAKDNVLYKVWH